MNKKKYFLYLILGNIITLIISFIITRTLKIPFKWWNTVAITSSSYIFFNYLQNKKNK